MKKGLVAAAIMVAGLSIAPAAYAADVITISGASGTFGNSDVACTSPTPCSFTSTFNFLTPTGYNLASATISSIMAGSDQTTNIDFSNVTLNGVAFNTIGQGVVEFRDLLNQSLNAGANNLLVVSGTSGGNASFAGTLSFAQSAVPEPATWALMLLGFAAVGFSMRSRKKGTSIQQLA